MSILSILYSCVITHSQSIRLRFAAIRWSCICRVCRPDFAAVNTINSILSTQYCSVNSSRWRTVGTTTKRSGAQLLSMCTIKTVNGECRWKLTNNHFPTHSSVQLVTMCQHLLLNFAFLFVLNVCECVRHSMCAPFLKLACRLHTGLLALWEALFYERTAYPVRLCRLNHTHTGPCKVLVRTPIRRWASTNKS